MDYFSRLHDSLSDGRLGVNLIAGHGMVTAIVLMSLLLRRFITHSGARLEQWTGLQWMGAAGEEAARRGRKFLFWLTLAAVFATAVAGSAYHLAGRDMRIDAGQWYRNLTLAQLTNAGFRCGLALAAFLAAWAAVRAVRRIWPGLEENVMQWIGQSANDKVVRRIAGIVRWYTIVVIRIAMVWFIARLIFLDQPYDGVFGFVMRIFTLLVLARLLILSSRILLRIISDTGNRYLTAGKFKYYWEGTVRLLPLGEHCLDGAIYVLAAWLCIREFTPPIQEVIDKFAPRIIGCIGILFLTRVLIELFQVLLAEAFGLYKPNGAVDQKKQTLVPLLNSVSQYVFYFGSALLIMEMLWIPTTPFLAGAGILGLAVGLGAQNLVTDVVSGFFILFENQFLVGDYIKVGDAAGKVEAVGIRVTHIRDEQGKLHIIPNGQIKGVVSYSKCYVNAVIDLKVPSGTNLEEIFRAMAEAGRRLRQKHHEVLSDTQIQGLVELNTSDMTIRAVTKVKPGAHAAMQNEYRRVLKEVLDQSAATPPPSKPAIAA